jgi:hypothetical protein
MGNARDKLNVAYFNGAVLIAAIFGAIAGSWLVFFLVLGLLVVGGLMAGNIRL